MLSLTTTTKTTNTTSINSLPPDTCHLIFHLSPHILITIVGHLPPLSQISSYSFFHFVKVLQAEELQHYSSLWYFYQELGYRGEKLLVKVGVKSSIGS
ncbi:unnamed protein product [Lactuca virosa]|uniref:Uncharacterized protein n=1 Tax=Lactuca virosa TaxID=75947 RepID=A0AAU9PS00_9ASTR|nr:unnamed protein product [Lactuca virosa]